MNEAPKKIWYSFEYEKRIIAGANEEDTPYIRADLVDGLVEALELLVSYGNVFSYKAGQESPYKIARAALKSLEEK